MDEAEDFAEKIGIEHIIPRVVQNQKHRSNPPSTSSTDYWKKSILIPYLDSLMIALNDRFPNENLPAYSLLSLHPHNMLNTTIEEAKSKINISAEFYSIENLECEIEIWKNYWMEKKLDGNTLKNLDLCEVLNEANTFFPSIKKALIIAITLPCTTCTIERSFSTLRRVKTWLRSTMCESRLTGNRKSTDMDIKE